MSPHSVEHPTIAVVGGGNGSYTAAADLTLAGYSVRFRPGSRRRHADVLRSGTITVTGLGRTGVARPLLVSHDLRSVVSGADIVICTDPAFAQPRLATLIASYLSDGQIVFLSPGSLGSYLMASSVRALGISVDVTYAEPGTLPYLTRKTDTCQVQVSSLAVHLPIGVYPAHRTDWAVDRLRLLFPGAHAVEDVLSVALLNVGPIIHSVLVLLSTAPIEHFPSWDIHNEGTTPSVKKLILALDAERIAVREALGYVAPHYPIADHYHPQGDREWMYGRGGHTDLVKSEKWREPLDFSHRYVREDVHETLALLAGIGDLAGVDTPLADSVLRLFGAITGCDHLHQGRTPAALGLGGIPANEVKRILREGRLRRSTAAATTGMNGRG